MVKQIVSEPESAALAAWLRREQRDLVVSDLVRTEVVRAVRRYAPELTAQARSLFDSVSTVRVTRAITESAAMLDPRELRSLDALHLATALAIGDDLDGLVTYDQRLARAAQDAGIATFSPR